MLSPKTYLDDNDSVDPDFFVNEVVTTPLEGVGQEVTISRPSSDELEILQLTSIIVNECSPTQSHPHCISSVDIILDHEAASVFSVTGSTKEDEQKDEDILAQIHPMILPLTQEFPSLFSPPDASPPPRDTVHDIVLKPDARPVKRAAYPLGASKLEAMKVQIKELSEKGWIEPSVSPWASPILFVKKKEGEWRLVIDFRDLNALTIDDSFPLPRVETLLHRAGKASVFSQIDLASGFHQIALAPLARAYTAFRLPEPVEGCTLWQWRVMPFGLRNAPPTFQRAMTKTLCGCEDFAVVLCRRHTSF